MTKRRAEDNDDLEFQIRLYRVELGKWPDDVALYVLETQPNVNDGWWPAWHDLQLRLETYGRGRRRALMELQRLHSEMEK